MGWRNYDDKKPDITRALSKCSKERENSCSYIFSEWDKTSRTSRFF